MRNNQNLQNRQINSNNLTEDSYHHHHQYIIITEVEYQTVYRKDLILVTNDLIETIDTIVDLIAKMITVKFAISLDVTTGILNDMTFTSAAELKFTIVRLTRLIPGTILDTFRVMIQDIVQELIPDKTQHTSTLLSNNNNRDKN